MEWMLMPYRRYADFSGRSRRMEFWMFSLFCLIVYVVLAALMIGGGLDFKAMMDPSGATEMAAPGVMFYLGAGLLAIFALGSIIPSIAVTVRRLHDQNYTGWIYLGVILLGLIPLVGLLVQIAFIVVMCLPGTKGPNKYGADPLDPSNADVFE